MSNLAKKDISETEISADLVKRISENHSISNVSYLATDYLNHFNEVIMLLDMISDMPDLIEELLEWQALDYVDHFKNTALGESDLIIDAYWAAKAVDREMLKAITHEMDIIIKDTISAANHDGEMMDPMSLTMLCATTTEKLRERINLASGVINNGAASVAANHDIDLEHTSINYTQATADILFGK